MKTRRSQGLIRNEARKKEHPLIKQVKINKNTYMKSKKPNL